MVPRLFKYQQDAVNQLKTGSILCGGVGSGKSLTALTYYYTKEDFGRDLYIITTAKKRDALDWHNDCTKFSITNFVVDSWNNIDHYTDIENCFFIFDEQRVIGTGSWVKSFLKIVKKNNWILLSATPGDTWLDYAPVFIANGFYKNITDFKRSHVVYNTFVKFPKVDHYVEESKLRRLRDSILVVMDYTRPTEIKSDYIVCKFDEEMVLDVTRRWNPYFNRPIRDISEYCFTFRRVVNSDSSRLSHIQVLIEEHKKLIVFYNFNYELDILRFLKRKFVFAEYNGFKHEPIPESEKWVYVVQYMSGSEGWNCIETNVVAFYSLNYSYRIMRQAAGRIDRLNTPFTKLYYYYLVSNSWIDQAILKALKNKKNFNESLIKFREIPSHPLLKFKEIMSHRKHAL